MRLDIAGGDARLDGLQLKVVPNPTLNLKLVCDYPPYMERSPLTIDPVSGAVPVRVPIGSRVTIRGTADKPLETARIDCPAAESSTAWHRQFRGDESGPERNEFTYYVRTFPRPHGQGAGESAAGRAGREKGAGEKASAANRVPRPSPHEITRSSSPSAIPTD